MSEVIKDTQPSTPTPTYSLTNASTKSNEDLIYIVTIIKDILNINNFPLNLYNLYFPYPNFITDSTSTVLKIKLNNFKKNEKKFDFNINLTINFLIELYDKYKSIPKNENYFYINTIHPMLHLPPQLYIKKKDLENFYKIILVNPKKTEYSKFYFDKNKISEDSDQIKKIIDMFINKSKLTNQSLTALNNIIQSTKNINLHYDTQITPPPNTQITPPPDIINDLKYANNYKNYFCEYLLFTTKYFNNHSIESFNNNQIDDTCDNNIFLIIIICTLLIIIIFLLSKKYIKKIF